MLRFLFFLSVVFTLFFAVQDKVQAQEVCRGDKRVLHATACSACPSGECAARCTGYPDEWYDYEYWYDCREGETNCNESKAIRTCSFIKYWADSICRQEYPVCGSGRTCPDDGPCTGGTYCVTPGDSLEQICGSGYRGRGLCVVTSCGWDCLRPGPSCVENVPGDLVGGQGFYGTLDQCAANCGGQAQCQGSCSSNRPCAVGECISGFCQNKDCRGDTDCICRNGIGDEPAPPPCGASGQVCCSGSTPCNSGLTCNNNNVCETPQPVNYCNVSCGSDAGCPSGYTCFNDQGKKCRLVSCPANSNCQCSGGGGNYVDVTVIRDDDRDGRRDGNENTAINNVRVRLTNTRATDEYTGQSGNLPGNVFFADAEIRPVTGNVVLYVYDIPGYTMLAPSNAGNRDGPTAYELLGSLSQPYQLTFLAQPPPECSDGIDNDGDAYIDSADPGCPGGDDERPFNPPRVCDLGSINCTACSLQCGGGGSQTCTHNTYSGGGACTPTTYTQSPCLSQPGCSGSQICTGGTCVNCGAVGQVCCSGAACNAGLLCSGGFCLNISAWWQVRDSDLAATGDLRSSLPAGQSFSLNGSGGYPGIPAYSGTLNLGSGSVSANNWKANSGFTGRRWDYAYFTSLVPPEVFTDAKYAVDASVNVSELKNQDKKHTNGYFWNYRNGDLAINGTGDLGDDRVIVIVNGNLTIGNNITLNDGKGFFATIVRGNTTLAPQVSHPNNVSLEGMFMSDGTFNTGAGSGRLYLRGAIAAWGGINLQRDLGGSSNRDTAAELIEYAPDMILTFPRELLRTGLVWREVAP